MKAKPSNCNSLQLKHWRKKPSFVITHETQYLDAWLREVDFERHFFAHENVWISSLLKQRFEHVKLWTRKSRSLSPLLSAARYTHTHTHTNTVEHHSCTRFTAYIAKRTARHSYEQLLFNANGRKQYNGNTRGKKTTRHIGWPKR